MTQVCVIVGAEDPYAPYVITPCCQIRCYAFVTTVADIFSGKETQCPGYKVCLAPPCSSSVAPTKPSGKTAKPTSVAPTLKQ